VLVVPLFLAALAPIAGCGGPPAESARREFARLKSCPEDQIKVTPQAAPPPPADIASDPARVAVWKQNQPEERYFLAEGCGTTFSFACWRGRSLGGGWSCGYSTAELDKARGKIDAELVKRAAFDLSCPEASLRVVPLGDALRGVEGCDKKATYVFDQQQHVWVMNNDGPRADASAPAAPSPAAK
jgi:hypothetical protein